MFNLQILKEIDSYITTKKTALWLEIFFKSLDIFFTLPLTPFKNIINNNSFFDVLLNVSPKTITLSTWASLETVRKQLQFHKYLWIIFSFCVLLFNYVQRIFIFSNSTKFQTFLQINSPTR